MGETPGLGYVGWGGFGHVEKGLGQGIKGERETKFIVEGTE